MVRRSERSGGYPASTANESGDEADTGNFDNDGEDLDEEQEVTRCLCGQDELRELAVLPSVSETLEKEYGIKIDHGLFIQCDKCSVWQHGYCVGLFTNDDVPDKYWCELCKPDLHLNVSTDDTPRTLYKPVNEKRKKLMPKERTRPRRDPKATRKDRRLFEDTYEEQLQKALRDSAKEAQPNRSNDEEDKKSSRSLKDESLDEKPNATDTVVETEQSAEENDALQHESSGSSSKKMKRPKSRTKTTRNKVTKPPTQKSKDTSTQLSRDELINQASKPRYVGEKSSIFELRKRTSAILEWLGRSQVELGEEKMSKIELFNYKENASSEENRKVIQNFNENLKLMEQLTESILAWEQKFGKFAP
jgi:hypothetical protein